MQLLFRESLFLHMILQWTIKLYSYHATYIDIYIRNTHFDTLTLCLRPINADPNIWKQMNSLKFFENNMNRGN